MKLTIGLPTYETYKHEMVGSVLRNLQHFQGEIYFSMPKGCYIDTAREFVMCEAIKAQSDKVVFWDSDIACSPHALQLILSHDKPIVGANYHKKQFAPDGRPMSTVSFDDGHGGYASGAREIPTEPFECAAVGTGFMAIDLPTIIDRMCPPWFEYDRQDKVRAGEDTYFCQKARAAGLEVWCDPRILIKHMGDFAY